VLAYNPQSAFAAELRSRPWYDVLEHRGLRFAMTDPKLDPKGELTVQVLREAQRRHHLPVGFAARLTNRASVFPEPELLGRLESGQLDAAFFYRDEAKPAHLPVVSLGQPAEAAALTVTVLQRAPDPAAGVAFVRYLLTAAKPALVAEGLDVTHPVLAGDRAAVPAALRPLLR
jgi:molybdate/tungstate transport system substrate-binding protein